MKTIIIANDIIGCGCNNIIHHALASVKGVYGVRVNPEKNEIIVDHTDETDMENILNTLESNGYNVRIKDNSPDYCNKE